MKSLITMLFCLCATIAEAQEIKMSAPPNIDSFKYGRLTLNVDEDETITVPGFIADKLLTIGFKVIKGTMPTSVRADLATSPYSLMYLSACGDKTFNVIIEMPPLNKIQERAVAVFDSGKCKP